MFKRAALLAHLKLRALRIIASMSLQCPECDFSTDAEIGMRSHLGGHRRRAPPVLQSFVPTWNPAPLAPDERVIHGYRLSELRANPRFEELSDDAAPSPAPPEPVAEAPLAPDEAREEVAAAPDEAPRAGELEAWVLDNVRRTPDGARVAAFDVIKAFADVEHPRTVWQALKESHPEVVELAHNFKFPGRGQRATPTLDLEGVLLLIMALPGRRAAAERTRFANIIRRHLQGELASIREETAIVAVNDPRARILAPFEQRIACVRDSVLAMLDDHGISPVSPYGFSGKSGVYIMFAGVILPPDMTPSLGTYLLTYGETGVSVAGRADSHAQRYASVDHPQFVPFGVCVYFRANLASRDIERDFGYRLRVLGVHCGDRYRIADERRANKELFHLTDTFTLAKAIAVMDEVTQPYASVASVEAVAYDEADKARDHEFRMRQEEVKLEVERAKIEQERAKAEQLRLQLEILRLTRGAE